MKKTIKPIEGFYAKYIVSEQTQINNAKRFKENEDVIIRTEIHGIIIGGLSEGRSKEEILDILNKVEKYNKYSCYFENWIDDRKAKMKKKVDIEIHIQK